MQMTDHILFVKETKTCSYVLVVHTPRLCGEPGFKSRHDAGGEAEIRCRAIVDTKPPVPLDLPTADYPLKYPLRKTVLPAPLPGVKGEKGSGSEDNDRAFDELLRKTLAAMASESGITFSGDQSQGELMVEMDDSEESAAKSDRLINALRAAGFQVETEVIKVRPDKNGKKDDKTLDKKKKVPAKPDLRRDEL
jgi:protein OS-9